MMTANLSYLTQAPDDTLAHSFFVSDLSPCILDENKVIKTNFHFPFVLAFCYCNKIPEIMNLKR
jgi:hypothetical protein